ncbi:MAG: S8 family serine peptidase [Planctomycetota bacterium]
MIITRLTRIGLCLIGLIVLAGVAHSQADVDPDVFEAAADSDVISIIVFHRLQPASAIARQAAPWLRQQIEDLSAARRELDLAYRPAGPFATREEEALAAQVWAQSIEASVRAEAKSLDEEIDHWMTLYREDVLYEIREAVAPFQADLEDRVVALGGEVYQRSALVNSLAVLLPSSRLGDLAQVSDVLAIGLDRPGAPETDTSVPATGAPTFWSGGLTGGTYDFGLVDTGVEATHPAFSAHRFFTDIVGDTSFHGTHVTGIVASADATHRGGAYGLDAICSALGGSTSTSMTGFEALLSSSDEIPEVINHSWGYGSATADDSPMTRFCDAVVNDLFTMVTKSAGNNGCNSTTSSLTYPGPGYNLLVVGNMNDQNTIDRSDDHISSDSSRGPTASDRRKPDLVAPGSGTDAGCPQISDGNDIVSTNSGWATGDDFVSAWGTSMAAPHVASGILLLAEAGVLTPMAQKAILINTAETWTDNGTDTPTDDEPVSGDEWNKTYGWGALDLENAYYHRLDYFIGQVHPRNEAGSVRFYKGPLTQGDKLTLAWERRVGSNGADSPTTWHSLSDLNLRLYNANTQQLRDADLDGNDNVHQVSAPTTFDAVAKVYAWSTSFDGASVETFALATEEGWEACTGPLAQVVLTIPETGSVSDEVSATVTVTNAGDLPLYNPIVTLHVPAGFFSIGDPTIWSPGTLQPGQSADMTWRIRTGSIVGDYSISAELTSNTYGEVITGSDQDQVALDPVFRLLLPADQSVLTEAPELRWIATGEIDLFAVELSIDGQYFIWNSFLNQNLIIVDQRFQLPSLIWRQLPPGWLLYWRVRGVRFDQGDPWTIYDSDETWRLEKQ